MQCYRNSILIMHLGRKCMYTSYLRLTDDNETWRRRKKTEGTAYIPILHSLCTRTSYDEDLYSQCTRLES